jgi:hypothetical protein
MPTTTKVFKVKSGTIKAGVKGGDYAELIEERDGKEIKHRIFKSVQRVDGSWVSLKDELEILIEKIGNNEIEGMLIGLDKEQDKDKKYWNVIAVDFDPPDEPEPKPDKPAYKKPEYRGRDDEPAPQAVGMTVKQVYEMIRDKTLEPIFGREAAGELVQWYRSQILGTTRISFNGADLPPASQPEQPRTISVGDIKEVAYNQCGWTKDQLGDHCEKKYKVHRLSDLDQTQTKELIDYIKAHPKK